MRTLFVPELMKKIESLSEDYMKIIENETLSYLLANKDRVRILNSWWLSLIFFFDRVFYQGRRDEVSGMFEKATIKALEELLGETSQQKLDGLLSLKDRGCLEYQSYQKCQDLNNKLKNKYPIRQSGCIVKLSSTGKERDREMTVDTLKFVAQNLEDANYNILKYTIQKVNENKTREIHKELVDIRQVGDKTASLFLRDTVAVYDLTEQLEDSDYIFLQPIDTWVRQVFKKLKLTYERVTDEQLKNIIVKTCLDNDISPIRFNQGIWYLGSHSLDVIFKWFLHV